MAQLIQTHELSKRYGPTVAVNGVNLSLESGGIIGLVGKNGAGKTTFLSMLSGALEPTSGKVGILGHPASASELLGRINILLQDADFKRGIPVSRQLTHFARLQGLSNSAAKTEVSRLLKKLNNAEYADKTPESLSVGQRKRLGITQTFIGSPQLILLDEPTAGLDPIAAADVRKMIQSFVGEMTFIISSHNLYEIQDICSHILVMDKGELKINSSISELSLQSNHLHITLNKAASADLLTALSQYPHVEEVMTDQASPEKISMHLTTTGADALLLQIQGHIIEQGYSVLQLNRGENLLASILTDITPES